MHFTSAVDWVRRSSLTREKRSNKRGVGGTLESWGAANLVLGY